MISGFRATRWLHFNPFFDHFIYCHLYLSKQYNQQAAGHPTSSCWLPPGEGGKAETCLEVISSQIQLEPAKSNQLQKPHTWIQLGRSPATPATHRLPWNHTRILPMAATYSHVRQSGHHNSSSLRWIMWPLTIPGEDEHLTTTAHMLGQAWTTICVLDTGISMFSYYSTSKPSQQYHIQWAANVCCSNQSSTTSSVIHVCRYFEQTLVGRSFTVTSGMCFSMWFLKCHEATVPIGSMYAIYGNIYHQYTPNVSIYTIHGSYGTGKFCRYNHLRILWYLLKLVYYNSQ